MTLISLEILKCQWLLGKHKVFAFVCCICSCLLMCSPICLVGGICLRKHRRLCFQEGIERGLFFTAKCGFIWCLCRFWELRETIAFDVVFRAFFLSFSFFFFLGPHPQHMKVPRLGVDLEPQPLAYASATATPDPQQLQIQAISATYNTARGNARPLTHWARPEVKPASSWFLVRFHSTEPKWELLQVFIRKFFLGLD